MSRHSELRFSKRHGYHSTINGKRFYFGKKDKVAARNAFIETLSKHNRGEILANPFVSEAVAEFLAYKQATTADSTYKWYEHPLKDFSAYVGPKCRVSTLSLSVIEVWIAKNWSKTQHGKPTAANSLKHPKRAVKSCFHWLSENKRIGANPVKGLKIGDYTGTKEIPTREQLAALLKHFEDDKDFIDLLQFEAISGARVEETRTILSSQVSLEKNEIELSPEQTKMFERLNEKRVRTIVLNAATKKIVERNLKKNPHGLLFQNPTSRQSDSAWTPAAVRSRFIRAEKTLGFRIQQKGLRHYFATEFLTKGGSIISGSILMGHASSKMIDRNYQKVIKNRQHLQEQAGLVKPLRKAR